MLGEFNAVQYVILVLLGALGVSLLSESKTSSSNLGFPSPKSSGLLGFVLSGSLHDLVQKGYNTYTKKHGRPFVVKMFLKPFIILPPRYFRDIKGAKRNHLSFVNSISEVFFLRASVGNLLDSERLVRVVQKGMNPRLPKVTLNVVDEASVAFGNELCSSEETTTTAAGPKITAIVQKISSRMVMGVDLARDEEFLRLCSRGIQSIFINAMVILFLPLGPLRPYLIQPITKFIHMRNYNDCLSKIGSVVRQRIAARQTENYVRTEDGIEWTLDQTPTTPSTDAEIELISKELLQNLWAATSSPASVVTEMLFQALRDPSQYLDVLRAEAQAAHAAYGWGDNMINSLQLQDSFIREVNRMYPTTTLTCVRTVMDEPFTFQDGFQLPVGSRIAFALDAAQHDDDNYPNPDQFDGFRFIKLQADDARNEDGVNKWAASHASPSNLVFGFGNHVCPGRFMAVRLIKVIFSTILLNYKVEWDRPRDAESPPRIKIEGHYAPNQSQKISFTKLRPVEKA